METARKIEKLYSNVLMSGLRHLNLVEVQAGLTWDAVLEHRIYSCPGSMEYMFVFDATDLLLKNRATGFRVPLNVESVQVCNLTDPNFIETVPEKYRVRLTKYIDAVQNIPGILNGHHFHRFYFLSNEPWPEWLQELTASASETEWSAILSICIEPYRFFKWPKAGTLLWDGCTRGDESQRHEFPPEIISQFLRLGLPLDTRNNGPAIMSYQAAGGIRPTCGNEGWHIHHIYDGTSPINGIPQTVPHAVRDGKLFTHSAGLVAAHPVAHHFAHQSNLLKWLLRREAFVRFDFDPMNIFPKSK